MKIPPILIVLFSFWLPTNAQSSVSNVVQADKTEIHGDGKNDLGYIIHISGLNTPLFLENSSQIKDSLGRYITEFKFGNPNPVVSHRISLILQFNGEVDSVNFFTDGTAENIHTTITPHPPSAGWNRFSTAQTYN
jgi:hypothetical protein